MEDEILKYYFFTLKLLRELEKKIWRIWENLVHEWIYAKFVRVKWL